MNLCMDPCLVAELIHVLFPMHICYTKTKPPRAFSETVSVSSQAIAVFVLEFGVCCWLLPVVSVFEEVFSCCSFSRVFADPLSSVASFQADLLKNQLLWTSFIARSAATEAAWNTWICDKRQDWK